MLRLILHLKVLPVVLLVVAPVYAQRDRDTYTPGQTFEVSGVVHTAETGAAAQNVMVKLERFSGGVVDQMPTDNHGRFRFTNLQRGYYKVIINVPGFHTAQQDADLQVLFRAYLVFDLTTDKAKNSAAIASLGEVIDARVPADAREEYLRGRSALAKNDHHEAIVHLQRALTVYSGFFEAQLLLATAFVDLREWAKAESSLQRALELKPDNPATMLSLGEVYWRQKRFKDAEDILLAGLKLDDKSWSGYFTLGRLYWDKNDVVKAGAAVGKTLQLKPDFAEAHLLAGNILLRLNQQQRALIAYQEYLKFAPKGEYAPQARDMIQKLQKAIAEGK